MSAKWSPNISTLIGAVSGSDFAMWDIAKNVFLPANIIHFEGAPFTRLLFSKKGSVSTYSISVVKKKCTRVKANTCFRTLSWATIAEF